MPFQIKSIHALIFSLGVFVIFPLINCSSTLDPETVWRSVAMGVLILPYMFYYLVREIKGQKIMFPFLNNRIIIFFFLYCIISTLSLIKAVNPGDGLFDVLKLFLYLAVIFIVARLIIESKESLNIIIKSINISVILFSAFGFIQLIGLYTESKDFDQAFAIGQSLRSALGNKNSYSEVLFLCLPFCLYGVFEYRSGWKLLCIFNSLLGILSIFILMNLYVWLALVITAFFILLLLRKNYAFLNNKKSVLISSIIVTLLLSVAILFFVKSSNLKAIRCKIVNTLNYIKHPETIGEYNPLANDNNIHERLVLAKNTAKMIKANWITGVGVSNWKIYEPIFGQTSITSNIRVDYPHNDYLGVFAETGILGIICYILFLFFAIHRAHNIYKSVRDAKTKTLNLLILGGILGFVIIAFFGFAKEKFFPMILLCVMIAIVISHENKENSKGNNFYKWMLLALIPFVILLIGVGVIRISSEMHLQKALKEKKFQRWNEAIVDAGKAYSCFYPVDYSSTPIQWHKGMAYFYSDKIDSALIYLLEGERSNPFHVQLLNDIGTCYELKNDHKKSIQYYQRAFQLDPRLVKENLVAAYFNSGQLDNALDLSCDTRFGKRIFLEEILQAKAIKFCNTYTGDKDALLGKIKEKGWLIEVFDRSNLLKMGFEEAIRDEIAR